MLYILTLWGGHIIYSTVMYIKKLLFTIALSSLLSFSAHCDGTSSNTRLGVWITVFSQENILFSTDQVDDLIKTCVSCGIDDIYLQVYRADKAYYNSSITDSSPYNNIVSNAGTDTVSYLIKKAKLKGISVHAWMNLLSIAQNENTNIVKTLGKTVLTVDQHGRTALKTKDDPLDKYYIREDQLFLEPGNKKVREYLSNIACEIIKTYPDLSGMHLDYIRYPSVVPFIPGSRFTSHGISYGYGKDNLEMFKKHSGIDIVSDKYSRTSFMAWDKWRRNNVTSLVRSISEKVKGINPDIKVSCTIVPSMERTYLTTFQDWTSWLDNGYADYIVAMDYTDDVRLFGFYANSVIAQTDPQKIQIGMGAYLLEDKPEVMYEQLALLAAMPASGIVIFSYDDIADNEVLQKFLTKNFK